MPILRSRKSWITKTSLTDDGDQTEVKFLSWAPGLNFASLFNGKIKTIFQLKKNSVRAIQIISDTHLLNSDFDALVKKSHV